MKRLAALLLAIALPLHADDGPESVVRAFYDAYAAGDLATAAQYWDPAAAPAFTAKAERHLRVFCLKHHKITVSAAAMQQNTATVEADASVTVTSGIPGAGPRSETRFTTFELQHGERWRITKWIDREAALADRIAKLPVPETGVVLESAGRLRNPRLARELCRVSLRFLEVDPSVRGAALLDHARTIALETGDDAALSVVRGVESTAFVRGPLMNRDRATEVATAALALAERSGDPDAIARALFRVGRAESLGRATRRDRYDQILALAELVDDVSVLSLAASHLSYASTANPSKQLRYALTALQYAESSADSAALFYAHYAVGGTYANLVYPAPAIRHFVIAEEIAMREGATEPLAIVLFALLRVYNMVFRHDEARKLVERALPLASPNIRAYLLQQRGNRLASEGRVAEAARDFEEAVGITAAGEHARLHVTMGLSRVRYLQGRYEEALEIADEAVRMASAQDPIARSRAAWHAATVLRRMKRYGEARTHMEAMRRAIGDTPKIGFDETKWPSVYQERATFEAEEIALAVDTGDAYAALGLANETRGRALRAYIERRKELPSRFMSREERAREASLNHDLAQLNRQLIGSGIATAKRIEIAKEVEEVRLRLDELRGRAVASHAKPVPAPSATVDPLDLAPGHAVIHYIDSNDEVVVIGMGPGKGRERRLIATSIRISRRELSDKLGALMKLMETRDLRYARAAREMFDLLLGPVSSLLGPDHKLCIIPDGYLWRVPFHALRVPDGRYVAEVAPVFYAAALALADRADGPADRVGRDAPPNLVAFANPELHARSVAQYRTAFTGADVGRLPEAEDEVREIGRLYGPGSRVYVGEAATESALKSMVAGADIIHLATHGSADAAAPLASAVLFAPGAASEDGILEAREILALDLKSRLAVLSACDSGRGQSRASEGIIGLAWAFLAAGCPTTVVSQWKATSSVTSRLMIAFHRHLREGDSEAEALRKAQNEIRRDPRYRHPYYWAPFVVMGAQ